MSYRKQQTMSQQIQAKYCPQCHAMNRREAETCTHCGRRFSSSQPEQPQPDAHLNRTQMFTLSQLPHLPQRAAVPEVPAQSSGLRGRLISALAVFRFSPLLMIILALALLIAALVVWAARSVF
jgi:ribosomal protein L40E